MSVRGHANGERGRPSAAKGEPAPRTPTAAELVVSLQRAAGNRASALLLARQPSRTPLSPAPGPARLQRATYEEQTTYLNKPLAQVIDKLSLLSPAELADLQDTAWTKAAIANHPKHAAYMREVEALEFLESQGRVLKRLHIPPPKLPQDLDDRRTVRRNLEGYARRLNSFDDAALELQNWAFRQPDTGRRGSLFDRWDAQIDFYKKEMADFGQDFTRQAREIAIKMLAQSQSEILSVIESYGLRRYTAFDSARRIAEGADADKEVKQLVHHSGPAWDEEPDKAKPQYVGRRHRAGLGRMVTKLKNQQELVRQAQELVRQAQYRVTNHPMQDVPALELAQAKEKLAQAKKKLAAMWLEAERQHPAIAAFRGSEKDLEDVKLGALDDSMRGSEPQMTELLEELLPKLADIMKARGRIDSGHLKPLTLPPVVALTKAVMFIPEGSLRAGKVNDLIKAASKQSTRERIAEAAMALIVLATLIPSGGTSVGIGIGLVSAALSAESALKSWEEYQQKKLLANTSLDRAKALSLEEPSLGMFALDLVLLGLDGTPLLKAFSQARSIKALLGAGAAADSKAVKELVADINNIGRTKGEKDLGEKALKEAEAAEKAAASAGRKTPKHEPEPKPKEREAGGAAGKTSAAPWKPPPGSPHPDVASLRRGIHDPLTQLDHGWANMNSEWIDLLKVDRNALIAKYPQDRELWEKLDEAYTILRDPKELEEGMVKIYVGAAQDKISPEEWLMKYFGGRKGMPILDDVDPEKFRKAMLAEKPALDDTLKNDTHGLLTHMFQEFVLAEKWGSREAARNFRHAIANVQGGRADAKKKMFSRVWDALFDSLDEKAINRPEFLGPILHQHLKLPGRLRPPPP